MEPYGGLLVSRQNCTGFHANGLTGLDALRHWGLTRDDEDWPVGLGNQSTLPNQPWSGQRGWMRAEGGFPEFLSLQERVVGTALFKMDNQQWVTVYHGELHWIIWQPGWAVYFGDQDTWIHMVESIYCPPETQNIVNQLYSNTKYSLLIIYGLWGCRRTSILCRENKEQESEGKKQGERRTMDILFLF